MLELLSVARRCNPHAVTEMQSLRNDEDNEMIAYHKPKPYHVAHGDIVLYGGSELRLPGNPRSSMVTLSRGQSDNTVISALESLPSHTQPRECQTNHAPCLHRAAPATSYPRSDPILEQLRQAHTSQSPSHTSYNTPVLPLLNTSLTLDILFENIRYSIPLLFFFHFRFDHHTSSYSHTSTHFLHHRPQPITPTFFPTPNPKLTRCHQRRPPRLPPRASPPPTEPPTEPPTTPSMELRCHQERSPSSSSASSTSWEMVPSPSTAPRSPKSAVS